jgi:hypothetical protein
MEGRRGVAIAPPPGLYTAADPAPPPLYCPFAAISRYEPHRPLLSLPPPPPQPPQPPPPPPPQQPFWQPAAHPQPMQRQALWRAEGGAPGGAPLLLPPLAAVYASGGGLGFSAVAAAAGEAAGAGLMHTDMPLQRAALRFVTGDQGDAAAAGAAQPGEEGASGGGAEKKTRWA